MRISGVWERYGAFVWLLNKEKSRLERRLRPGLAAPRKRSRVGGEPNRDKENINVGFVFAKLLFQEVETGSAQGEEFSAVAEEFAAVAAFVLMEVAQGVAGFVDVFEGEPGAGGHVEVGGFGEAVGLGVDFAGVGGGGEPPGAHLAPFGYDHGFDEHEFVGRLRFEFDDLAGEEALEFLGGFAGDQDCVGDQAVTEGVAGGDGFAVFGDGAVRLGSVEARGFFLGFGAFVCHFEGRIA